jgi:tripartite-type tricarboxylate transporter receptor subunit TctC
MVKALQMPDVRQRLMALGYEPLGSTPLEFAANLKSEMAKWAQAAKEAKIRVE